MDDLNSFDLDSLMQTGVSEEELQQLMQQMSVANALRGNVQQPEMRGNGRVQTAANPLEFIGAGLQALAAKREAQKAQQRISGLQQAQGAGRKQIADRLYGKQLRQYDPGMQALGLPADALEMPQGNF